MNIFYKSPLRRIYTWKSPLDNLYGIVNNQIDYISTKKAKTSIKETKINKTENRIDTLRL